MPKFDFSSLLEQESQEAKKTPKVQKFITPKRVYERKKPKIEKKVDWNIMNISQDDLWFLYRLKFGKGTRDKRSVLLPKFTEAFNRNLKDMRKKR